MFRGLTQVGGTSSAEQKSISPTLRSDIYTAIDQCKGWISGDGVSYTPVLNTIQKHFPSTRIGLEAVGKTELELAVLVGGITNMILEMSKWEALGGGMAMRTWVDTLANTFVKLPQSSKKDIIARGIVRGINQNSDYSLMTREFTAKIQIISCLKSRKYSLISLA